MPPRATLRSLTTWATTLLPAASLALLLLTWVGRWVVDLDSSSICLYRGVVFTSWVSQAEVERELQRLAPILSLPQDQAGDAMLQTYRKAIQDTATASVKDEAGDFAPARARGYGSAWLWLGGTGHPTHSGISAIAFPLWPLLAASLPIAWPLWLPALHAWRESQRTRCRKCNYDRRGLAPDAKCPECGTSPG